MQYDQTVALWDISLQIPAGQLIAIVGQNGAGKSTFIKAILSLVKPISGHTLFFGKPWKKARSQIAYVPQRASVDWDFPITVRELVLMGRHGKTRFRFRPSKYDLEIADRQLEAVGMSNFGHRQISELSGGQQQRVFLARALAQEADIYFMDEPFVGVDHSTELILIGILKKLKEEGKTIFVVHHDLNSVESIFDWVILLNIRLIAAGPISSAFNSTTLHQAYGKNYTLLDEVLQLSQKKWF